MSKARRRATAGALALLTAAAAWGCGSSEAPEDPATGIAESAQAPAPAVNPPANRAPVLGSVAIQPWEPLAGELVTARITGVRDVDLEAALVSGDVVERSISRAGPRN